MRHIFISHAGADSEVAHRLYEDLRNAGHQARIDICELTLGDNSIRFMNDGIQNAHTIVILYSKHTPAAAWQKVEIDSAFWNEVQQEGGRCLIIRLDDTKIPPLLGPKVFETLAPDRGNYMAVLEKLCQSVLPHETASSLVASAFQHGTANPFRRVRAEFFEDLPHLLAEAFAPPESMKANALEEMKPCFLEGPRGTGKSMLLLSLRARNLASRKGARVISKIFGFYLKLTRGAVCNAGIGMAPGCDPNHEDTLHMVQLTDAFAQEITLCLLESLTSELTACLLEGHIVCNASTERAVVRTLHGLISHSNDCPDSIEALMQAMAVAHRDLAEFMRRKFIYCEQVSIPIAGLDIDALKRAMKEIKKLLPELSETLFVILLDEYENLFPFQQRVVNTYVKLAAPDFSVKAAKKVGSHEISSTTLGQDLQEIHDYNRVRLVYDVEDANQFSAYFQLMSDITQRLLKVANMPPSPLPDLLPDDNTIEVSEDVWFEELASLCNMTTKDFCLLAENEQANKKQYYGEAAVYRSLYGKGGRQKDKRFAGGRDLGFLSSGVIRYFLEFLGVAYYLKHGGETPSATSLSFESPIQTQAVHTVSRHYLTTLSRNVEKDGERLKYYLLDIGDCLRHKLLKHTSEPEAGRLTIVNPEVLEDQSFFELRRVLALAIREGVFQEREGRPAFKPKHRSDPQPAELTISRVYVPVLQISPRMRWRTNIKCEDLLGLWEPSTRSASKREIMRKIAKNDYHPQLNLGGALS